MTLKEKIEVMQHFERGGEVEYKTRLAIKWLNNPTPHWDWITFDYRIKPKPVELLYEWWIKLDSNVYIETKLRTTEEANRYYSVDVKEYGKTGRWFNPETKEFGNG